MEAADGAMRAGRRYSQSFLPISLGFSDINTKFKETEYTGESI